jgi:hypothetical protein
MPRVGRGARARSERALILAVVLGGLIWGCGVEPAPASLSLSVPQALTGCDGLATPLQARLWVSGFTEPFALTVNDETGAATGAVRVPPGVVRRFTVDWFAEHRETIRGTIVVLAQVSDDLDLSEASTDTATVAFAADAVTTTDCRDMADGSVTGSATIDIDGTGRPVCDLDGDGVSNLVEVCAGDDPLEGAP